MPRDFEAELAALKVQERAILADQAKARGNKKFSCVCCGKMHTINKCDAFTFPWWERGTGYEDDRWYEGCLYIVCPETKRLNRCYFSSPMYPHHNSYEHSAELQFKSIYKSLFKSLTRDETYRDGLGKFWINNTYFDKNHAKFGLKVKKGN